MSKPRKKYRPKIIVKNPMATFFGGMSGEHAEHLATVNIKNHAALAALAQGNGGKVEWDLMAGAMNMGVVMAEMGIGPEFLATIITGREALLEVGKRGLTKGRFVFTGDELAAMNEAMACHDAQVENVRAIDLDRAAAEVERRLRSRINSVNVRSILAEEQAAAQAQN
jgi:hypothetical protein